MKLDKRLKCDAENDASTSVPAATLKLIFTDCTCAVLFIRNTSRDTLLKFSDIHKNINFLSKTKTNKIQINSVS